MDFSLWQVAIVLVIALLVFGPKRLPELGKSLGAGMREFKDSISGKNDDDNAEQRQIPTASQNPPATPPTPASKTEPVEGEVVTENKA
jgi:sec-independent protein translocase protein TatA